LQAIVHCHLAAPEATLRTSPSMLTVRYRHSKTKSCRSGFGPKSDAPRCKWRAGRREHSVGHKLVAGPANVATALLCCVEWPKSYNFYYLISDIYVSLIEGAASL